MRKNILIILFVAALAGCAAVGSQNPISETRLLLDTVCTVTIYGTRDKTLLKETLDLCEEYESMFGMRTENSDIWRINHAGGIPIEVSPQTAEIIAAGIEYGRQSGGKFDITIGRLSALWDFSGNPSVPPATELSAACETVDYSKISVNGNVVTMHNPDAWIDLGGIAKGYIAGKLADYLKERGVMGAVIDLGGDVCVLGEKPDGGLWRVGIRKPNGNKGELVHIVSTTAASVVTSGTYERQFTSDGVKYHHILDPSNGMPSRSDVISATVVTENSIEGDVLSTLIVLTGSENVQSLLDTHTGLRSAFLVLENGECLDLG